jgi:hypothetical protein
MGEAFPRHAKEVMKKNTKRWLGGAIAVLFGLWLLFLGYIDWAMHQPPEVFGHVMARMPMPAYFLFPFETMWIDARKGVHRPDTRYEDAGETGFSLGTEAGCPGFWQLYLTAFSAGGSRPKQIIRAVQGQGRFLCGLHPGGPSHGRLGDGEQY